MEEQEKKKKDGRANNGALKGVYRGQGRPPKAREKKLGNYALGAMKKVFGSEQEAMETLAEFGKKGSLAHMKFLMEYGFGKPNEMNEDGGGKKTIAPVINFYNTPQIEEHTIDVDHTEEDDDIEDVDYE